MNYKCYGELLFEKIRQKSKEEKLGLRISEQEIQQYVVGKEGEDTVNSTLREYFPQMILLDDIYMNSSDLDRYIGGYCPTMQIDHILISDHAIYVIETKKYSKDVELGGSSYTKTWEFKDDKIKKSTRPNADKQNQSHVTKLRKLLELGEEIKIVSIVCLVNMNPKNIHVSTQYGQYVFVLEEVPIMIAAFEQIFRNKCIERCKIEKMILERNIKSFSVEVNHIIYVKLLKRNLKERAKGKRRKRHI